MPGVGPLHAALLIDFDNVTMGMRSDLSKELKSLLDTDVIKGKVSVQRAYADWRRYPQYIVPLSEASVDLIFAPAYGSNKKNATDIRMAIDALELVFIRPEIGTYILLTGDSDFSSLVLKLKEYGKYVIGVGIQESSSDILVQNCDEYYSYTSLTGLTKTTDLSTNARDPWVLVKDAVTRMASRGDVMRSDRLKQVMQELDPAFEEGSIGFSKFSKFLAEASSRGLVSLRKLENGQYEVTRGGGGRGRRPSGDESRGRRDRGRGGRQPRRDRQPAADARPASEGAPEATQEDSGSDDSVSADPLQDAYETLTQALDALRAAGRAPVRDSDVKRKILERNPLFDETELGFAKFSRFLSQAADHGVIRVEQTDRGNLDVWLAEAEAPDPAPHDEPEPATDAAHESRGAETEWAAATVEAPSESPSDGPAREASGPSSTDPSGGPIVIDVLPPEGGHGGLRLGPRRGSTRRRGGDEPPPFFEGQATGGTSTRDERIDRTGVAPKEPEAPRAKDGPSQGLAGLGLPSDPGAIARYLTHRYKGVGEKTAEMLVERFGASLFATMQDDPDAIASVIPAKRAEQLLEAWRSDYDRRTRGSNGGEDAGNDGRRGGRGRSRGRGRN